ncbi:MAG: acyltransferase [Sphingobacteriales bacterium]|nr:acyltransferase [Sphingobacteriales bacterium]
MTTKSGLDIHKKLYGLDHLRALAIIVVFFYHYFIVARGQPKWLPDVASFGWTGVDLFFVLSGFLISSQIFYQIKQEQPISFKIFFIKRFFRIVPAFLVTVGLYFCFPFFREREALPPLWKVLTFTQNLGLDVKDFGTFSHAWSLCVEEHFYLFFPIVLIFLQRSELFAKSYWLLIVLFLFGFGIRLYCYNYLYIPKIEDDYSWMYWHKYIYYPTYSRLDGLLVGVSLAGIYVFLPKFYTKISQYGNHFILLSLCILTSAYFLCEDQQTFSASIFGFPLIALGFGSIVLGSISPTSFLYKWNSKTTTFIANLSFAIYLIHKGIIHVTHKLLDQFKIESNIMLIICIITCILAAYLLHLIIEKPFMKLRSIIIKGQLKPTANIGTAHISVFI